MSNLKMSIFCAKVRSTMMSIRRHRNQKRPSHTVMCSNYRQQLLQKALSQGSLTRQKNVLSTIDKKRPVVGQALRPIAWKSYAIHVAISTIISGNPQPATFSVSHSLCSPGIDLRLKSRFPQQTLRDIPFFLFWNICFHVAHVICGL